ncbi:MAG: glycosyltransferase [Mucilaginibacter sp.]|uniref:glycosyltransferase family protein n=1 Tax=Mucilaginibacter sp. TaxID=1882438 RepID=UPI0034E5135D
MKIFLSFLQSPVNYAIPAYNFWQCYIKNGIEEAGHQWAENSDVDWALGIVPKSKTLHNNWKQETWGKTVAWLKKNPVDLFLSYLYPEQIDVHAIAEIQKAGIPCINFFCDNIRLLKKVPDEFACFDLNWVPEFEALSLYAKAKYQYIYLPMPMWVDPTLRSVQKESFTQLTFLGSKDIQRQLLFENIIRKRQSLPLKIYGNGWMEENNIQHKDNSYTWQKKVHFQYQFLKDNGIQAYARKLNRRKISNELSATLQGMIQPIQTSFNYEQLTARSMITIGVNRYPSCHYPLSNPNTYSRLRDIEAPMLGACYLTEWAPGLDLLYDLGTDIETYKNEDEFIYKANLLMADPERRKQLKINGQARALKAHTISESLKKLIDHLKL